LTFLAATGWASQALPAAENQVGTPLLEGSIASERGEPLVGAIISVFGANLASGGLITISDENGRFRVSDLPPGLYTLRAYLSGFLPSRSSKVEVSKERGSTEPVLMKLARLDPQDGALVVPTDMADGDSEEQRTSELKWLLRHGKRNVLHKEGQGIVEHVADNTFTEHPVFAQSVDFQGEVGLLASASDLSLSSFPSMGSGLDARLAYARLDIPTGQGQRWEVSAQLMESILSSWAGGAQFIREGDSGSRTAAGVTYGNHLYGDLQYLRPPEAGLGPRQQINRSTEWFGSVFGAHSFKLGSADVDAGMVYHYYSYLDEAGYAAPSIQVAWSPCGNGKTVLKGMVDYKVHAPGSEDLNLLARMVRSDFRGAPQDARRGLRAEKTLRSQVALQQTLGDKAIVELRLFQEEVVAQLVKAYLMDQPLTGAGPGRYLVYNQGDYRTRGVGLAVSRRFGSVASSVGYRFGLARAIHPDSQHAAEVDEEIHDLTTSVETEIDLTRTRLLAVYRLMSHPSFLPSGLKDSGTDLDSRFNFQVYQMLPFEGWNSTEWELMLAIRNLFYEDIDGAAFLDELAVIDSPRRILGGVSVRF
jgi:hypothetical protein